jgi:hypothetical protein
LYSTSVSWDTVNAEDCCSYFGSALADTLSAHHYVLNSNPIGGLEFGYDDHLNSLPLSEDIRGSSSGPTLEFGNPESELQSSVELPSALDYGFGDNDCFFSFFEYPDAENNNFLDDQDAYPTIRSDLNPVNAPRSSSSPLSSSNFAPLQTPPTDEARSIESPASTTSSPQSALSRLALEPATCFKCQVCAKSFAFESRLK